MRNNGSPTAHREIQKVHGETEHGLSMLIAHEALRLCDENFALVFANSPAAIALTRLDDGVVLDVNDSWVALTGWTRDEAIGRSAREMDLWPTKEAAQDFVAELKAQGTVRGWERDFSKKSGDIATTQISAQILKVDGEDVILSTLVDISVHREAEIKLSAAHGRINDLLEQMSDGFAAFDREWRYTHINSAAARAFCRSPEQLLGRNLWEMWPAAYDLPVGVTFRRSVEENIPITFETFYPAPLERWFECRCYPTTEGLATFFIDITDRKLEQDELAAAKERLQQVLSSITDGYYAIDYNWRFTTLNRIAEAHFGAATSELIGRDIWEVTGVPASSHIRKSFLKAAMTQKSLSFECESVIHRDVWTELHLHPRKDVLDVYFRDITERKRAEEAIRAREAMLRGILDAATEESIWLFGRDDTVLLANRVAAGRLDKTPEEVVGENYVALIPAELRGFRKERIQEVFERGQPLQFQDERAGIRFHHSLCPVKDEDGDVAWVASFSRDITEQKRAEEALRKTNEELERRVLERTAELREKDRILLVQGRHAALGEMIGNIAHQWRQPLNVLGLLVQQIPLFFADGRADQEYADRTADKAMELIAHMSRTIDDFRNFFNPQKEKTEFKVREELEKIAALAEGSLRTAGVRVHLRADADPVVHGYPNEFSQAMLNLLMNSRDAAVERNVRQPEVVITVSARERKAIILLADNAGGIPEEIMEKIFDPYFTTKGPQYGTGVGLFMTKTIIEKNMGGRIEARNTPAGAEFRVEV